MTEEDMRTFYEKVLPLCLEKAEKNLNAEDELDNILSEVWEEVTQV